MLTTRQLKNIPKRVKDDLKIISLAANWKDILRSKLERSELLRIELRGGSVLAAPPEVSLNFLFHEIWIEKFYTAPGYEIKNEDIVIDIGANIGVFALWAICQAKNVAVHSFEPFPGNAEYLRRNVEDSKAVGIFVYEKAVAATNGKRRLGVSDSWILHTLTEDKGEGRSIEVDCISLDSVVEPLPHCDLLKLDCEGGEGEILSAASELTLSKIDKIVCEFNFRPEDGKKGAELQDLLERNGYVVDELRVLNDESGILRARRV